MKYIGARVRVERTEKGFAVIPMNETESPSATSPQTALHRGQRLDKVHQQL